MVYKVTELAPAGITDEQHLRLLEEFLESTQRKIDDVRRKLTTQASNMHANSPSQSHPHVETLNPDSTLVSQVPQKPVRCLSITTAKKVSPRKSDVDCPITVANSCISIFKTKEGLTFDKPKVDFNSGTEVLGRSKKEAFSCRIASPEHFSITNACSSSSVFRKDDPGIKFALEHCYRRPNTRDFELNLTSQ